MKAKKALGQNFIKDRGLAEKIVRHYQLQSDDVVVEIGPGLGAITRFLLDVGCTVIAIEKDHDCVKYLQDQFCETSLQIIHADILNFNLAQFHQQQPKKIVVVGNLPYYISTPILEWTAKYAECIQTAFYMLQLELAQRLVAQPRSKAYGALTCCLQLSMDIKRVMKVGKSCFKPVPKVDSAVIALHPQVKFSLNASEKIELCQFIKRCFQYRRKKISKALNAGQAITLSQKKVWDSIFSKLDIDQNLRPDQLTLSQYYQLFKNFCPVLKSNF